SDTESDVWLATNANRSSPSRAKSMGLRWDCAVEYSAFRPFSCATKRKRHQRHKKPTEMACDLRMENSVATSGSLVGPVLQTSEPLVATAQRSPRSTALAPCRPVCWRPLSSLPCRSPRLHCG